MSWGWRRLLLAAAGAMVVVLLSSASYAADSPYLSLDPLSGPSGTTVTAQGTGFCVSCGHVEIDFGARPVKLGIIVASNGSFKTTFVVPGGAQAGTDAVNAYQQGKLVTQTSFTVTPSVPPPTTKATPRPTNSPSPVPSAGGGSSPGPSPSATPQPTTTPTANVAGPSPSASNGGTGSSSGGGSAAPAAIVLSVFAILVVAMALALIYRWLKSRP